MLKRYQLYYHLVDVSFWITAIWLASKAIRPLAPKIPFVWDAISAIYTVLYPINILLAIFLVLARFMRDELAERVWQITARRFVNFMIIGPIIVCILAAAFSSTLVRKGSATLHPDLLEILQQSPDAGLHFMLGIIVTLFLMAQLIPTLFILFLRWGLWRDSR